jgi:hypothetical protein
MATAFDPDKPWEQVHAELRAQRSAQKQAWGDLDDIVLGRYLADEVDSAERRRIETVLDERPELRQLTDLVRDVLAEFEPTAAPSPVTLPFPAPTPVAARPAASVRLVRRWWQPRYAGLVAAAAVLLALGLGLGLGGVVSRGPGANLLPWSTTDERASVGQGRRFSDSDNSRLALNVLTPADDSSSERRSADAAHHGGLLAARSLATVQQREFERLQFVAAAEQTFAPAIDDYFSRQTSFYLKQGKEEEARSLANERVAVLNEAGQQHKNKGDYPRSESALARANQYCDRAGLGERDPLTAQSRRNHGELLQVALVDGEADAQVRGLAFSLETRRRLLEQPLWEKNTVQPMLNMKYGAERYVGQGVMAYAYPTGPRGEPEKQAHKRLVTDPDAATVSLCYCLEHPKHPGERVRVAWALAELGPDAHRALPLLAGRLQESRDATECVAILVALNRIGATEKERPAVLTALHGLHRWYRPVNVQVRNGAVFTLHNLSSGAVGLATGKPLFLGR